jgi:hypothetical protein
MPYFKKGLKTQVNERLDAWVKSLSDLDTSAYAWAFPENTRYFHDSGDDFCPGVAVLIKEVKR